MIGRYKLKHISHKQGRPSNFPRRGSFITLTPFRNSNSHIFVRMKKSQQPFKIEGKYNSARPFTRFEKGSAPKDRLHHIKTMTVKQMKEDYDIEQAAHNTRRLQGFGEWVRNNVTETCYQVSKFAEGKDFIDYIFDNERDILEVIIAAIDALQYIHNVGHIHGDFHYGNIIIDKITDKAAPAKWDVQLIDLDFAINIGQAIDHRTHAPETKEGSLTYAHPNQDVYDVGRLLLTFPETFPAIEDYKFISQHTREFISQLGTQTTQLTPEKRPTLAAIKHSIINYLALINKNNKKPMEKELFEFEHSKQLLQLFLEQQITSLTYESSQGSKGANEKKAHFEKISQQLNSSGLTSKDLNDLIMKTALVAHHRRKRNRDRLLIGLFTVGLGFFCGLSDALSWRYWQKMKFPAGSSYAAAYNESLENNTRRVTIGETTHSGYESLRHSMTAPEPVIARLRRSM